MLEGSSEGWAMGPLGQTAEQVRTPLDTHILTWTWGV